MAYIYRITNTVNGKVYIGKTELATPLKRWTQHKSEMLRERSMDRPLYRAMRKYGISSFVFEVLLETSTPEEDEVRLIAEYRSYVGFRDCNGYNATLGGDGKSHIDPANIVERYLVGDITLKNLAKECGVDICTARKYLRDFGIEIKHGWEWISRPVVQYSKLTGEELGRFCSTIDAARSLGKAYMKSHIASACRGVRKTACGFKWGWA